MRKSIADYGDAKVSIIPTKAKQGKYHTVTTEIDLGSGVPTEVSYVFRRSEGVWKVFDLRVESQNLVTTFRRSFKTEIEETSLDALIERLANTNAKKNQPVSS